MQDNEKDQRGRDVHLEVYIKAAFPSHLAKLNEVEVFRQSRGLTKVTVRPTIEAQKRDGEGAVEISPGSP